MQICGVTQNQCKRSEMSLEGEVSVGDDDGTEQANYETNYTDTGRVRARTYDNRSRGFIFNAAKLNERAALNIQNLSRLSLNHLSFFTTKISICFAG
jgi:hypothetical protein